LRQHKAFVEGIVNDAYLNLLDGYRRLVNSQNAGVLARSGANATCEFREVIGCVKTIDRLFASIAMGKVVPLRY
jgi:hypothetical protein